MEDESLARLAGEAFQMMAGLDLASDAYRRPPPGGFSAGPSDDPGDPNVEPDPDEHLPWPDPQAVKRWWEGRRDRLRPGTRYLLGQPLEPDWLERVLREGKQRQRVGAALELAIRRPGRPLFELRAPGRRQRELLSAGAHRSVG
jgi:uncharacterized protein (TIGR02270 family)